MFLGIPATNLQSSKAITIVTMKVSPSLVALVTGLFNSPVLVEAFHGMGQPTKTTTLATGGFSVARGNMRRTRLFAMKKKEEKKIETRQVTVTDPLKLLILYATPWRNPNSIFVYLFVVLFVLGKYSEAHHGM
jgi:hypothetical protein